jgi:hypothetical protein
MKELLNTSLNGPIYSAVTLQCAHSIFISVSGPRVSLSGPCVESRFLPKPSLCSRTLCNTYITCKTNAKTCETSATSKWDKTMQLQQHAKTYFKMQTTCNNIQKMQTMQNTATQIQNNAKHAKSKCENNCKCNTIATHI